MSSVVSELKKDGVPALSHVEVVEKVVLPTAKDIAAEKEHREFLEEIASGPKEGLKDVPDPSVRSPLPTKEDIEAEKSAQEHLAGIHAFPKDSLKEVKTPDDSSDKAKFHFAAEKVPNEAAAFDQSKLHHVDTNVKTAPVVGLE